MAGPVCSDTMRTTLLAVGLFVFATHLAAQRLAEPVRLQAGGVPIDLGALSSSGHAGPALGDVDGDGDRDLLVGDFPGHLWLFANVGTDRAPVYAAGVKLMADGKPAKVPVY